MLKIFITLALCATSIAGDISITNAWAKSTVPGQSVGGAYLTLISKTDARLVSVSSSTCENVEIHEMSMDKGIMKMRELPNGIALPAGKSVELKPGGLHLMLMNLKAPLQTGQSIALKLTFEQKGKRTTEVTNAQVKAASDQVH